MLIWVGAILTVIVASIIYNKIAVPILPYIGGIILFVIIPACIFNYLYKRYILKELPKDLENLQLNLDKVLERIMNIRDTDKFQHFILRFDSCYIESKNILDKYDSKNIHIRVPRLEGVYYILDQLNDDVIAYSKQYKNRSFNL